MAPKKAASKKKPRGQAAAASAPSLAALPPEVLELVASHLLDQDKLNNIQTTCQDIANLACTSKALSQLAKERLWGWLGELYSVDEAAAAGRSRNLGISFIPKAEWYENEHLETRTRKIEKVPAPKAIAEAYEQEVPEEVPSHIYAEFVRLRCLSIAASNAKTEYHLAKSELDGIAHEDKSRGSLGTVHLYRLVDVIGAGRRKHGSVEGMVAYAAEKAQAAIQRKAAAAEKADTRRQALVAALQPLGITLSNAMCKVPRVGQQLKSGKASALPVLLPYLQLLDWCQKHTGWSGIRSEVTRSESRWMSYKVSFRDEDEGGYFGNDFYGKADKATASLSEWEEDDCVRLACQEWAAARGGMWLALGQPEVPGEGPLRDAIALAMRQKVLTSVPDDSGRWDYSGEGIEAWHEEDMDMGEEEGLPPAGGQAVDIQAFFQRHTTFLLVECTAASNADLAAWETWAAKAVARAAHGTHSVMSEPCPHAFRPPPGVPGTPHRSLIYVGVANKLEPVSLATGEAYGNRWAGDANQELKSGINATASRIKHKLERWAQAPRGLVVGYKSVSSSKLPAWVREQVAGEEAE